MSNSKRRTLETLFPKLFKLMPHLGNPNEGERANAISAINRLLERAGLDWHDLVTLLSAGSGPLLELVDKLFAKDTTILIKLAHAVAEFFHSADGGRFPDIVVNGERKTLSLSDSEFAEWLLHLFFNEMKKAPGAGAMKAAIQTLSAHATFNGENRDVHLRSAKVGGKIYFDIGDSDWSVVEVDASGWRMTEASPVRFRRTAGMIALPLPERGGSIEPLRDLVNLTDQGFVLFVSWILDGLHPARTPHPLLYLAGEQGSAKTTAAKIARSLVDPNEVPLRNLPTTARDLFISANGSRALAFDNISSITATISDTLCQIASGSGFGTRKLYANTDQIVIGGSRPVILNGLLNAITRSDLADRTLLVSMARISSEERRSESEIWNRFEDQRSQIFGALLNRLACGLRQLPHVKLSRLPRMADFAKWSVATEAFPAGVFLRAFESAAREQNEAVAESDPVVIAVAAFMMKRDSWEGTVAGLLRELGKSEQSEAAPTSWKKWPAEPSAFGKQLRSTSPVLQKLDVGVEFAIATSRNRTRNLRLFKVEIADTSDTTAQGSPASSASPATSGTVAKFKKPPGS